MWTVGGRRVRVSEGAVDEAQEAREHDADGVTALCSVGAAIQKHGALRVRVEQRRHLRRACRELCTLHQSFTQFSFFLVCFPLEKKDGMSEQGGGDGAARTRRRKSAAGAFPASRIKRIIQMDRDIGKVSSETPAIFGLHPTPLLL